MRYQPSVEDKVLTINNDGFETAEDNIEAGDDVVEQVSEDVEVAVRKSTRQPRSTQLDEVF